MEKLYEALVLTEEDFGKELWNEVGKTLELLTKANYEIKITLDEIGIVVIKYNHDSRMRYGNATLRWVTDDEKEIIDNIRENNRKENN